MRPERPGAALRCSIANTRTATQCSTRCGGSGIPFVIQKFSILSSTVVRDLLAYLRLIGVPGDNVACARVLAAPYWGLEPRDLVRLAERAEKNHRRPLSDELETAQREAPFTREGVRAGRNS